MLIFLSFFNKQKQGAIQSGWGAVNTHKEKQKNQGAPKETAQQGP